MKFNLSKFSSQKTASFFFIISFLFYLFVILYARFGFIYDEGFYALMISEFSKDPSMIIPTLTGIAVEWKPPLFAWAYSIFYILLNWLPISPESIFRIPSAVFSALSVSFLYLIAEKLYDRKTAIITAFLFMSTPSLLFSSSITMLEALAIFFITASIYMYLKGKPVYGAFFLGLIILTKWLYVIAPVVFLVLYFLIPSQVKKLDSSYSHPQSKSSGSQIGKTYLDENKKKELKTVVLSFVAVPLAFLLYLTLSYFFGNFDNAILNLTLDMSRPVPSFDIGRTAVFFFMTLGFTFPLSLFFIFFLLKDMKLITQNIHLVGMGALAFLMPLSQYYIFWYSIIAVPAFALFIGRKIEEVGDIRFSSILVIFIMIANIVVFVYFPSMDYRQDAKWIGEFSHGKNVTLYDCGNLYSQWKSINERYLGTNESYLLLEQNYPGILFYRFNDTTDYENLHALFLANNDTIGCDSEYLIVSCNISVPNCYVLYSERNSYLIHTLNSDS
ncbi:glycosyltransferase family 39 protein [Candidatus Micrarchaeota archaeon]|nr:glycosyltransferase family 39 protein [Candidatus Micrarchaeota archaeon]